MNTLKLYPKPLREKYKQNIENAGIEDSPEKYHNKIFKITFFTSIISIILFVIIKKNPLLSLGVFIFLNLAFYLKISVTATNRIKKMETMFPDVISLMASNLKAGITIEKAFLLAARPEFAPLDKEILAAGKEISTGQEVIASFRRMSEKIKSDKISKVVNLISSGLKAGGNISELLEETASNLKAKEILEKKTASTTLMYVIFIFVAVSVGGPILFGLSSILVEIIIKLSERIPDAGGMQAELPFAFSNTSISLNFVIYFALVFLVVTDFVSCFVIGVVNKGVAKTGLKYFLPLLTVSVSMFYIIRTFVAKVLLDSIGSL